MENQSSNQNKKTWKQRALALGLAGALTIPGAAVGLTGCDNPEVAAQPGTEQPGASGNEDIGPESGMDNYQNGGDGEEQGDIGEGDELAAKRQAEIDEFCQDLIDEGYTITDISIDPTDPNKYTIEYIKPDGKEYINYSTFPPELQIK